MREPDPLDDTLLESLQDSLRSGDLRAARRVAATARGRSRGSDLRSQVVAHVAMARVDFASRRPDLAVDHLESACRLAADAGTPDAAARALIDLAVLHCATPDLDAALAAADRALQAAATGSQAATARALRTLCQVHLRRHDGASAVRAVEQEDAILQRIGADPADRMDAARRWSMAAEDAGVAAAAVEAATRYLFMAEAAGNRGAIADAFARRASSHLLGGQVTDAEADCRQALRLIGAGGVPQDRLVTAQVLLADILLAAGDAGGARDVLLDAMRTSDADEDREAEVDIRRRLAVLAAATPGLADEAADHYDRAIRLLSVMGAAKRPILDDVLARAAQLASDMGEHGRAALLLRRALDLLEDGRALADPTTVLTALARCLARGREYPEAEALLLEAERVLHDQGKLPAALRVRLDLGRVRADAGDRATARAYFDDVARATQEAGDRDGWARVQIETGWLDLREGDVTSARHRGAEALVVGRSCAARAAAHVLCGAADATSAAGIAAATAHVARAMSDIALLDGDESATLCVVSAALSIWRGNLTLAGDHLAAAESMVRGRRAAIRVADGWTLLDTAHMATPSATPAARACWVRAMRLHDRSANPEGTMTAGDRLHSLDAGEDDGVLDG